MTEFLIEWTVDYVKHRDIVRKSIEKIETKNNLIRVKYNDKMHIFLVEPYLDDLGACLKQLESNSDKETSVSIVMFNHPSITRRCGIVSGAHIVPCGLRQ